VIPNTRVENMTEIKQIVLVYLITLNTFRYENMNSKGRFKRRVEGVTIPLSVRRVKNKTVNEQMVLLLVINMYF